MRALRFGRIRCALGWSALALVLTAAAPDAPSKPRRLAGVHAFLFNSVTGGWSPDAADGAVDLGNVGASPYHSSSSFVVVDVDAGGGPAFGEDAKVRLTAVRVGSLIDSRKVAPRTVIDAVQRVYGDVAHPVSHLGFWLPENGCGTITLTATLTADGRKYIGKGSLGFVCSE